MKMTRKAARSTRLLMAIAIITAVTVGITIGFLLFRNDNPPPKPWNPLGEYPVQRVTSRDIPGVHGPSAWLDSTVNVTASKCSNVPNVKTIGHSAWQRVEPLGRVIATGSGTAVRNLGCTTIDDYRNDVPLEVISATLAVGGRATWRIVGEETPIKPTGEHGVPRQWQTQNFVLAVRTPG